MLKKFITLTNLNTKTMLKYGSVAAFSMLSIIFLFGVQNGMLAFPIALTAISLSFEDIHVKTIQKTISLILIDCSIVTVSFIASLNPYFGIPLNFATAFLIAYFLTARFNPKIYKPFMMLFVFTSFSKTDFPDFILRLESIVFGVLFVIILSLITSRKTRKTIIKDDIYMPLNILNTNIQSILEGTDLSKGYYSFSKSMRALCYKIYVTRYKNYFTTNIGMLEFNIYLILEKLNLHLKDLSQKYDLKDDATLKQLNQTISSTLEILNTTSDIQLVSKTLQDFSKSNINNDKFKILSEILSCLSISILHINSLNLKDINKPYSSWSRSDLESNFKFKKEFLTFASIKIRFSLRIAIALTITIFLGHVISLYKFIWVAITIMSVMQPYYEETISKGKQRLLGNLLGVTIIITLLHVTHDPNIAIVALLISLYFTYGFKEYYKLSMFTSIASISMASLTMGLTEITLSRISFILVGVFTVLFFNKFIFPYNAETGIKTLTSKLLKYNTILLQEYLKLSNTLENFDSNRFRDIVVLTTLNSEKLLLRNGFLNSKEVNKVVELNNHLTINLAFDTLIKKLE
ncbi:FUSC family protein [uncultured Clostridium sp.]|uniref:FUSC family protein n=1 Tax=uncultured Clostridium sp. TaxID=59620 RepID=UPI002620261E|nr:FUSC family protein [uncultured Clostridium sp.]